MKVAVTTAPDAFRRYAGPLQDHRLTPLGLSCIEIKPGEASTLDRLRRAAKEADLIVVTSARSVAVLWPEGDMPSTPVAVVGETTAGAVRSAGGLVAVTGRGGAQHLIGRLTPGRLTGRRVVYPHAAGADPAVVDTLGRYARGVVSGVAYRTVPIAPADDPVQAAVFASPSAVEGWLLARPTDGVVVAALGSTTAGALVARGRVPDVVAPNPTPLSLAASLAAHLTERKPA